MTLEEYLEREKTSFKIFNLSQRQIDFVNKSITSAWLRGSIEALDVVNKRMEENRND